MTEFPVESLQSGGFCANVMRFAAVQWQCCDTECSANDRFNLPCRV